MKPRHFIIVDGYKRRISLDVYVPERADKRPVVCFFHGFKGFKNWGAWHLMAEALCISGSIVLSVNFSGNGTALSDESNFVRKDKFAENNFSKEKAEVRFVLDWLENSRADFLKTADLSSICLMGHSRGGGAVLLNAGDPRVWRLISLASVSSTWRWHKKGDLEAWKADGKKIFLNGRTGEEMPIGVQLLEDYELNKEALDLEQAAKGVKVPWLILQGAEDQAVLRKEADNLKAWSEDASLIIIEGAGHTFGMKHPWEKDLLPLEMNSVVNAINIFLSKKVS